jgi:HNH endonuclease
VKISAHGYVMIFEPTHPRAAKRPAKSWGKGWIKEHQVVAERVLGRLLNANEVVHHVNGIKTDNRPENLQVLTQQAHRKLHNDEIAAKLQRLADYERLYGPLREGPVTEANLRTLRTKGIQ